MNNAVKIKIRFKKFISEDAEVCKPEEQTLTHTAHQLDKSLSQ